MQKPGPKAAFAPYIVAPGPATRAAVEVHPVSSCKVFGAKELCSPSPQKKTDSDENEQQCKQEVPDHQSHGLL